MTNRFQYTIRSILRTQAGLAGIIAVAVYVHRLEPSWLEGQTISGFVYAVTTFFWAVVGYCSGRCFFSRGTSLLLSMAFTAFASCTFTRAKCDHPRDFAILGMIVAISVFIGFGWLDRMTIPLLRWSGDMPHGPIAAEPPMASDRTTDTQQFPGQ